MTDNDLTVLMVSGTTAEGQGTTHCNYDNNPTFVPPEPCEGNVEYKLKLVNPTPSRIVHLVTQLKWRLREGQGEAIYEIGVEDSGIVFGLVLEDLEASLNTLNSMAETLGGETKVLRRCQVDGEDDSAAPRYVAEVLVRTMPDANQVLPLRVAVLGGVAAGKSTLLGVLTRGQNDNGRGSARLNLLHHLHEVTSGHTSSICHEILGFNKSGEVVNYVAKTAEEFVEQSAKLVSFVDLAGHKKYQHTTMFGLSCSQPEFIMLVVSSSRGLDDVTREHLAWSMALRIPFFVVVTKTDSCTSAGLRRLVAQLSRSLKRPGYNRTVLYVTTEADSVRAATSLSGGVITPVFSVSCVTGDQLPILKHFLNLIPARVSMEEQAKLEEQCTEFQVEDTYAMLTPSGHGTIVGGILSRGVVRMGDRVMVGPDENGKFRGAAVMDMRRNRLPCRMIRAGQVATIALPDVERTEVRRGSVLLSRDTIRESVCWGFEAEIYPLSDPGAIQRGRQVNVLMGAIRQGATVEEMSQDKLDMGQCTRITFRFNRMPEFVCVGRRLIVSCSRCKGLGEVTAVTPISLLLKPSPIGCKQHRKRFPTT